jgi:hypothetical protein
VFRILSLVALLGLVGCQQIPTQNLPTIGRACEPGMRGCMDAYPTYEVQRSFPSSTSQPGMVELKQGQMAVCH